MKKPMSFDDKLRFRKVFGDSFDHYYGGFFLGFDVVRFDEEIVQSGERSMLEVAKEKFGDEAVELLQLAINA